MLAPLACRVSVAPLPLTSSSRAHLIPVQRPPLGIARAKSLCVRLCVSLFALACPALCISLTWVRFASSLPCQCYSCQSYLAPSSHAVFCCAAKRSGALVASVRLAPSPSPYPISLPHHRRSPPPPTTTPPNSRYKGDRAANVVRSPVIPKQKETPVWPLYGVVTSCTSWSFIVPSLLVSPFPSPDPLFRWAFAGGPRWKSSQSLKAIKHCQHSSLVSVSPRSSHSLLLHPLSRLQHPPRHAPRRLPPLLLLLLLTRCLRLQLPSP